METKSEESSASFWGPAPEFTGPCIVFDDGCFAQSGKNAEFSL